MRRDRLARFRAELGRHDYGAALLSDPINIRYATGARNMAVWTMHAPGRYAFVPVDGPVVLFEFATSRHVVAELDTVDEIRSSTPAFYFMAGSRMAEMGDRWAREIVALTRSTPARTGDSPSIAASRGWPSTSSTPGIACSTPRSRPRMPAGSRPPRSCSASDCRWTCATSPSARMRDALRPGHHREPAVGRAARDEHRPRRRVGRVPACSPAVRAPTRGSRSAATASSRPATSSGSTPT